MKAEICARGCCRICGSKNVERFLGLPNLPFTDEFLTSDQIGSEFIANVDIFVCRDCWVAQTQQDVEVKEYYNTYRYTVAQSGFAQQFMRDLAAAVFERYSLQPNDTVIEIGSGDGKQLGYFRELGARILGVEPSAELAAISAQQGTPVVNCLFKADTVQLLPQELLPAKAVLLTYTFDHLPDPMPFLAAARSILDPRRGVLLIEVHDLEKILARRETCLFAHEHTIYPQLASLKTILERGGFRLLSSALLPEARRRGNSLLVAATPVGSELAADEEYDAGRFARFNDVEIYRKFQVDVTASFARFRDHVQRERGRGRRFAGYGAGGRGVMTLAAIGLGPGDIEYLCDQNSAFHGLVAPVSHVPVHPPARLLSDRPDEVIVFSYGYMAEIRQSLRDLEAAGTRIVSMLDLLA